MARSAWRHGQRLCAGAHTRANSSAQGVEHSTTGVPCTISGRYVPTMSRQQLSQCRGDGSINAMCRCP